MKRDYLESCEELRLLSLNDSFLSSFFKLRGKYKNDEHLLIEICIALSKSRRTLERGIIKILEKRI